MMACWQGRRQANDEVRGARWRVGLNAHAALPAELEGMNTHIVQCTDVEVPPPSLRTIPQQCCKLMAGYI
jgi:hypothetical protein